MYQTLFLPRNEIFWIGYTDAVHEGTWATVDNLPSPWFNWDSGQPNNWRGFENCAEIGWINSNYLWNDDDCNAYRKAICAFKQQNEE